MKKTFVQRIYKIQFTKRIYINNEFTKAINIQCVRCNLPSHFRKSDHELKKHVKFKIAKIYPQKRKFPQII